MALTENLKLYLKGLFGTHNGETDAAGDTVDINAAVDKMFGGSFNSFSQAQVTTTTNIAAHTIHTFENNVTITGCKILTGSTVVGSSINYALYKLLKGDGATVPGTVVASYNTYIATAPGAGTANVTVDIPKAMTLSTTAANLDIDAGETLGYGLTKWTSMTIPIHRFVVYYKER